MQKEIGQRIRQLRGEESQTQLAKELGINKSSLAMYERGERTPRDEVKVRIANRFGLTVGELFFDS
ncbi:MAG: helix-turn-helix transcriptional regulator [Oscillibacter ruminantium]|uniref:helix-turn-helix transcriptional regulator n=1 Tax=Oscillibacter ruminantium TaxID=1263547 RepID=UPI002B2034B1|nr:helix-turn-helix transcriptional regulator [Oscillibacter ruminantium]MEA5041587.1 helix-turn-helix transcriptional regulator [Oscillibacter ruminantium]